MKHIITLASFAILSIPALADDTEIYGTGGSGTRINSNVMFIMDTSGSMDGEVTTALTSYVPGTTYTGTYITTDIYGTDNGSADSGHIASTLTHADSTDCERSVSSLSTQGKVQGTFKQYRKKNNGKGQFSWRDLRQGNDGQIRCDEGNYKWLYTGNYLNWLNGPANTTTSTRLQVVVDVVKGLTESLTNINLGLMRFDRYSNGGMVDVPVSDITTSGALIRGKLDLYNALGGTPLTETMYEAGLYYRGKDVAYGINSSSSNSSGSAVPNPSVASSRQTLDTTKYKTPITDSCQKNHIILLTDGEASNDTGANGAIQSLISGMTLPAGLHSACTAGGSPGSGDCLDEYAYWLKNTDHNPDIDGIQDISTYTIGGFELAAGVDILTRAAEWGGGRYYPADNTAQLIDALDEIFLDILATDSTFTAPAVSVNAFNASEHRDELFYALFRPDDNIRWSGNLKKYKLTSDGVVIGDRSESPAVDVATGFFSTGIFDFWNTTDTPDGPDVTLGGFANKLPAALARRIYSNNNSGNLVSFASIASKATFNMATATDSDFNDVLAWAQGTDILDEDSDLDVAESRRAIGDPLHSEPVIVTYGGSDTNPDSTLYFGTNEGVLHAIDTVSGEEEFAFIPQELHSIQNEYFENTRTADDKRYGMDGPITSWFKDVNKDNLLYDTNNVLNPGEHVYLYAGMRRGGNSYYALDVTNRSAPSLLFSITGGITPGFDKLGQSWSKMTIAKVKFNNVSRFVLLFTGGYDINQDTNTSREDDTVGNAIYMVDATTGELLWSASRTGSDTDIAEMKNSIPASISAVDITGDGHVNYFFAADTGGRIFRFDINPANTGAGDFAKGGVIAQVGDTSAAGNLRFYNKPNISLVKDKELGDYLTIAIGSGYRAHPLDKTAADRFYVIRDFNPYNKPASYYKKTEANSSKTWLAANEQPDRGLIYNATSAMALSSPDDLATDLRSIITIGGGWYVEMAAGEKVLGEAITFKGAVIFSSFTPSGGSGGGCGADLGVSRLYALSQQFGTPALDLDDGASQKLVHSGIAPRPVIIYREGGAKTIAIGTETIEDERFKEHKTECVEGQECAADDDITQCESGNCYVTPVYWRQNDNE
jgi:type IV pilus assembly protein PilY1